MSVPTEQITTERLAGWEKRLSEQHATPILLLGVGHDHVSGQIVVLIPEETRDQEVVLLLQKALRDITQRN